MTLDEIRKILPTLPEAPGCYKYIGQEGTIIYVGKAKNLRRRVSSYFQRDVPSSKTRLLVRQIRGIEYVVVGSEAEALILENSLIKEHQPRYNILLKGEILITDATSTPTSHPIHSERLSTSREASYRGAQIQPILVSGLTYIETVAASSTLYLEC